MPDWLTTTLLVALGGGAGANARYWLGQVVNRWQEAQLPGYEFPWATFLINVSGSVVLGIAAGLCLGQPDPARRHWYLLLGTGFCGGYTTFSTFSLEALELLRDGKAGAALAYVGGSVAAGVLGVWLVLRTMGK
jgi:CrcB protein